MNIWALVLRTFLVSLMVLVQACIGDNSLNPTEKTPAALPDLTQPCVSITPVANIAFESCIQTAVQKNEWNCTSDVTELDCSNKNIDNPDGLAQFTHLRFLDLSYNQLSVIDLSGNTALSGLHLNDNRITSIDFSVNTKLTNLSLYNNELTSIDLNANTELTYLSLGYNKLTSIDLTTNTALTDVYLHNNILTAINLSTNTALSVLYVNGNELTSIDLSANVNLNRALLSGNNFDDATREYLSTIAAVMSY